MSGIILLINERRYYLLMSKPYIKVKLHSDVGGYVFGEKDLVIYYECDPSVKNICESDILSYDDALLKWVNSSNRFQKGDSNQDYEFCSEAFELIFLDDDQIKKIKDSGHFVSKDILEKYSNK